MSAGRSACRAMVAPGAAGLIPIRFQWREQLRRVFKMGVHRS
jgi:hypothetical protein